MSFLSNFVDRRPGRPLVTTKGASTIRIGFWGLLIIIRIGFGWLLIIIRMGFGGSLLLITYKYSIMGPKTSQNPILINKAPILVVSLLVLLLRAAIHVSYGLIREAHSVNIKHSAEPKILLSSYRHTCTPPTTCNPKPLASLACA